MTLEQFQNLKIGDIVVAKLVNSKQSRVNPVTYMETYKRRTSFLAKTQQ